MDSALREAFLNKTGLSTVRAAWIGGSATYGTRCPEDVDSSIEVVPLGGFATPFGESYPLKLLYVEGQPVLRVRMHGWHRNNPALDYSHSLQVFYVFRELGVEQVLVDASVGGITAKPWDIVIPDDFVPLDHVTRYEARRFAGVVGVRRQVRLADDTRPRLRESLIEVVGASRALLPADSQLRRRGVYFHTPLGPFETPAEIRAYRALGADVVGQTLAMEAMLARLNRMCLATLDVVANYAEGLEGGEWVKGGMDEFYARCAVPLAKVCLRALARSVHQERDCHCADLAGTVDGVARFPVE